MLNSRLSDENAGGGSNHLGSSVLDHPAPLVVRLARSAALCSGGHGHPLAARTVSPVLGPLVQLSSPATRLARYGLADSPIDRANSDGQSIVACATDSWRIEDAGHRNLRTHRLAHSAPASPATQSDLEDLLAQSSRPDGFNRFLHRTHDHHEGTIRVSSCWSTVV